MCYADDVTVFVRDQKGVSEALSLTNNFRDVTHAAVNWDKSDGFWPRDWNDKLTTCHGVRFEAFPTKYLGVSLNQYRNSVAYWTDTASDLKRKVSKCKGRNISIFARATLYNVFFTAKIWYFLCLCGVQQAS